MKRALLVIDVQNEYFDGKMPVTYPPESFGNILRAMEAAKKADVPVVVVRHASPGEDAAVFRRGSYGWELHPQVAAFPYDLLVDKHMPGSFTDTPLEAELRARGVERVVVAGYMTQMCCDTTSRQACHMGFSVEFLSDATGTLDIANSAGKIKADALHAAILVTQEMRFAEVISTDEWIERLAQDR